MNLEQARYTKDVAEAMMATEAYYAGGDPIMPDNEFDALVDRIRAYEDEHPDQISPQSPTQLVGTAPIENGIEHPVPMLSLSKVTTEEQVQKFVGNFPAGTTFLVQAKLDGVSMSLEYDRGSLQRAMTRGDGRQGEDVTEKIRLLPTVLNSLTMAPLRAITNFTGVVRGEVVIHRDELSPRFKNARNGVAGAIASSKVDDAKNEHARFYAFDVPGEDDAMQWLTGHGFTKAPSYRASADQVWTAVQKIMEAKATLPFDMDGVVIKVEDPKVRAKLEDRTNTPRWAIAFKAAGETAQARITGLKHQVGKSGAIGLVYTIEPTDLGGTTITNLTAHNFAEIRRKDVRLGDIVTIRRMGDVIPGVDHVTDPTLRDGTETVFEKPTECPGCGGELEEFGKSQQLRCTSEDCGPQRVRRLVHWASRKAADIDGLSTKMIEQLVDRGALNTVADFYRLTVNDFVWIGRSKEFGQKMIEAIETSKGVGMRRALIGLSIPNSGEGTAERLCKEFETIYGSQRDGGVSSASMVELAAVPDVGIVVATSLREFFDQEHVQSLLTELEASGVNLDRLPADAPLVLSGAEGGLAGKVCVITGKLTVERDDFKRLLEQHGAKVTGSVSKKSDYLVIGANVGATKTNKAREVGTTVITEEVAREMMGL